MFTGTRKYGSISVDFEGGYIASINLNKTEIVGGKAPLFTVGVRDAGGELLTVCSNEAKSVTVQSNGDNATAEYFGFDENIKVYVSLSGASLAEWNIKVENNTEKLVEWVKFPDCPV